ncbi:9-cis-epoxycarotenoid dioxygenase NCED6, chloroplastic [Amaranthus tricolor]|uniref:9-cis-epoxycarotenoid dioxygenase NCED6, chloroplastic n=1 Tax=Amaranthus tricolor TaxID=29722 RepID=UPI0025906C55|nr:9-cis-epoxycarotenoid dioxygenase NCED6, chloroplastic [Amaranthus tricolor]
MQVNNKLIACSTTTTSTTIINPFKHQNLYHSPLKITCKVLNPSKNIRTASASIISPSLPKIIEPLPKTQTESLPNYKPNLNNPLQRLASLALDKFEKSFILDQQKGHPFPKTVDPTIQLSGNYAPVQESPVQTGLEVLGEIPPDLHGVYVRNGANPMLPPSGAHHLFDGDGMIHAVKLGPGNKASYCCRFTKTNRFVQEKAAGRQLFPKPVSELHGQTGLLRLGLFYARAAMGLINPARGTGVANAGLVYFNGRLLAMSEDDLPYHVKINGDGDLITIGRFDFNEQVNCPLIAHPKVDPITGDFHTLSYDVLRRPYLKYFRFDKWGQKSREVHVPLPKPTMIHDFAITQKYVIIPDNQVVFKLSEMVWGGSPLRFDPNKKARFGILSKEDTNGLKIKWIEVPNSFCFHFINAWEENEGRNIVIIGSCMSPPDSIFTESDEPTQIELCEMRLDLETGKSTRRVIVSGMNLEVGQVSKHLLGRKTRYVYMAIADSWPKCDGIAKVDLVNGKVSKYMYGHDRYGGEPCFVPANYANNNNNSDCYDVNNELGNEDEGWIISFVRDGNVERSELVILTAKDMKQIGCVCMPSRVPYGFHGTFLDQKQLSVQKNN